MISERRKPLAVSFCISDLKRDILPLNITKLAKPLPKGLKKSRGREFRRQNANSVKFTGLLRTRDKRPCGGSTTEKPDEISSLHVYAPCGPRHVRCQII